ncbi:sensor histidine kinase [Calothrix sp. PCC 6303]|uniref:sensor histidine kinase n=1 Tax=Calothrix sp. PCC 6303 TaxID=1170562 RepID=UPI0002A0375B|nr:HAMP domain-containing sensor histidine kinase [Calothrix sp. PCC 6303]AFY99686.1 integral membrane sensor signal transduction histidine kinase [Calothrix sp. PCC 6303]
MKSKNYSQTKSLPLASRLFLSHLVVMFLGLTSVVITSKIYSPRFFILHLERLQSEGLNLYYVRRQLVDGFELAWQRSTFWSVLAGTTAAGGLSYWVSQRIMHRLTQMEEITQKFAAGQFDARLPVSDIPEFNRLGISFNRMADSLEGVEARRRELIGDMTHELRTPLTVIRGYLEELADGQIEPSMQIYQQLIRENKRLERLVNDVQELSKAEAGYLPINLQAVDIYSLLEALVQKFSDQLLEDGPSLYLESSANLPLVMADIDRTEQVLVNLIGNAIHYTFEGSIVIRVSVEGSRLWIAVTDTGIGIASEDLPHVFERFWRADKSRVRTASVGEYRHSGGSGVGLSISRRLVELQGGQIEVESQLGVGTTFRFCLLLL